MNFAEMKQRLGNLDTACICDAYKSIRVISPEIQPLRNGLRLIGRARTVKCQDDFLTVIKALQEAEPDEVLVINGSGGYKALAGELFATEAARKKLGGIVIDGSVRDVRTIRTMDIPVYARHIFPNAGTTSQIFKTQIPITCGNVNVAPGDILFGDDDGIIVATPSELAQIIPIAEDIQAKETLILERMRQGMSLLDMLNFSEHYVQVTSNRESKLKFSL